MFTIYAKAHVATAVAERIREVVSDLDADKHDFYEQRGLDVMQVRRVVDHLCVDVHQTSDVAWSRLDVSFAGLDDDVADDIVTMVVAPRMSRYFDSSDISPHSSVATPNLKSAL